MFPSVLGKNGSKWRIFPGQSRFGKTFAWTLVPFGRVSANVFSGTLGSGGGAFVFGADASGFAPFAGGVAGCPEAPDGPAVEAGAAAMRTSEAESAPSAAMTGRENRWCPKYG